MPHGAIGKLNLIVLKIINPNLVPNAGKGGPRSAEIIWAAFSRCRRSGPRAVLAGVGGDWWVGGRPIWRRETINAKMENGRSKSCLRAARISDSWRWGWRGGETRVDIHRWQRLLESTARGAGRGAVWG